MKRGISLLTVAVLLFGATPAQAKFNLKSIKAQLEKAKANQKKKAAAAPAPAPAVAPPKELPKAPVCDAANTNRFCYVFTGKAHTEKKNLQGNQMACKFLRGQYLASATCPSAGAMGACSIRAGQPDAYTLFYYGGGKITPAQAQADCKDPKSGLHAQGAGQWSAR